MGMAPDAPEVAALTAGGRWVLQVRVTDDDGCPVSVAPTLTITPPDASAVTEPDPTEDPTGTFRWVYPVPEAGPTGRWLARAYHADHGVVVFAAWVDTATDAAGMPTVAGVTAYLDAQGTSATSGEVTQALAAEAAAQRRVCRVGAVYPPDLAEALMRRVARNLALRALPLAVLQGDAGAGEATVLPGSDAEVRRLERPHRKVVIG